MRKSLQNLIRKFTNTSNKNQNNKSQTKNNPLIQRFLNQKIEYPFITTFLIVYTGLHIYSYFSQKQLKLPVSKVPPNDQDQVHVEPETPIAQDKKPELPKTKFEDCVGIEEIIDEMRQIVDFIKHAKKYTELGATFPKGILLSGPPGTGKTLIARALANEAGCHFIYRSGADFDFKFVGEGAKRVRELFEEARTHSPTIIFIDEIDAIGIKRGRSVGPSNLTINQLLTEMDGFQDKADIIVLGATNRADKLDPALLRPGRFDKTITISPPTELNRGLIIQYFLKKVKLAANIDVKSLAKETIGMTGADINNLVNLAAIRAVRERKQAVDQSHIEKALLRIRLGTYGRSNRHQDLRKIAIYQAAKSLVLLKSNDPYIEFIHATILPINGVPGNCAIVSKIDKDTSTKTGLLNLVDFYLAGRLAEELVFGKDEVSQRGEADLLLATKITRKVVRNFDQEFLGLEIEGKNQKISDENLYKLEEAIISLISVREKEVRSLLIKNLKNIGKIAGEIVKNETIRKTEMIKLLN